MNVMVVAKVFVYSKTNKKLFTFEKIFPFVLKRFAIIAGLLSGLLLGIATPFSKFLLNGFNSFQLAGLLYLGAALAMIPHIFRKSGNLKCSFKEENRFKILGIVFFGGFLGPLLLLAGLKTANAASVSIWLNMELVATAIFGVMIFLDTLDKYAWIGILLTISAGIITSAILVMTACICWAIDNHLTVITDGVSPQTVIFLKGTAAGSVNLFIGCLMGDVVMNFRIISLAIIVGVFSYGISILLYVISAQNIGTTFSQVLFSTAPLWGVILSYLFYQDSFHWVHIISIMLLAIAVIITNFFSHNHKHTHIAMKHIHLHRHSDGHHNHSHNDDEIPENEWHIHFHTHQPITHEHHHDPDLHHRHQH